MDKLFTFGRFSKPIRMFAIRDNKRFARMRLDKSREALSELLQVLFQETEDILAEWKHPDPYRAPTAPGGKY